MNQPSITICYILPISQFGQYEDHARRFVSSLLMFTGELEWDLVVVSNGGEPEPWAKELFDIPNAKFISRGNEGQDIGGYVEAAKQSKSDMIVLFGVTAYVKKPGWLSRIVETWNEFGPGMYGTLTSFSNRAHINTTGFACPPKLLVDYPVKVVTRADRYNFEHGLGALYIFAVNSGLPVMLVTWDGEYLLPKWRSPKNILRSGDQSNCLTYWHHADAYENSGPIQQAFMTAQADGKYNHR